MSNELPEDIQARVFKLVSYQLGADVADIRLDSKITDDLGADSLDKIELVMALEDEFEVEIIDDVAEKWVTVSDAVKYFEHK